MTRRERLGGSIPHRRTLLLAATGLIITCTRCTWESRKNGSASSASLPLTMPRASIAKSNWQTFAFPESSVEVSFPTAPVPVTDTVKTPIGPQPVTRYKAELVGLAFDAGYLPRSRNPLAALAGESRILRSACEGTAAHLHGTITHTRNLQIAGHTGREIDIDIDDAGAHHPALARLVMTDNRIYHAIVRATGADATSLATTGRRFVESLQFEAELVSGQQ